MKYGEYYVSTCWDTGIERTDEHGNPQICKGYFCQVYSDEEMNDQVDDFCLAIGHEIPDDSNESIDKGIRWYLGIPMEESDITETAEEVNEKPRREQQLGMTML